MRCTVSVLEKHAKRKNPERLGEQRSNESFVSVFVFQNMKNL